MSVGENAFDELAFAFVNAEYDFDAVERGPLRATWTEKDTGVMVVDGGTGESVTYSADDLVIATSDREVENARSPDTQ